jgi:hypothetical protein
MVSKETVMAKHVSIAFNKGDYDKLRETAGGSFSKFVRKLVRKALSDGANDKIKLIADMYRVRERDKVVASVYLDDKTYNELNKLANEYDMGLSTLIRSLALYALDYINDEATIKIPKPSGLWTKFDFTELTAYLECKNGHKLLELAVGQDMRKIAKALSQIKMRCPICGSNTLYIHIVVSNKHKVVANAQA